jgi:hypothetical protein
MRLRWFSTALAAVALTWGFNGIFVENGGRLISRNSRKEMPAEDYSTEALPMSETLLRIVPVVKFLPGFLVGKNVASYVRDVDGLLDARRNAVTLENSREAILQRASAKREVARRLAQGQITLLAAMSSHAYVDETTVRPGAPPLARQVIRAALGELADRPAEAAGVARRLEAECRTIIGLETACLASVF